MHRLRPARRALLGLLLVATASCGGDDDAVPSTTSIPPVSSTAPAPISTAPTTTTPAPPACPEVEVPDGAQDLITRPADLDGDGAPDELRSYRVEEAWHLQVELAARGGADLPIETFGGGIGVVGGADLDGDGADEAWARTGSGASTTLLGVARLTDCALFWVTLPGGERADLPVGGSVGTASGVECAATVDTTAHLTAFEAVLVGQGPEYEVTATEYRLDGTTLVEVFRDGAVVSAEDAEFARYTSFTCGDLAL